MDDDTGWNEVLVGVWGPGVRDAVVARVEAATIGARCLLVCTLRDEGVGRHGWVELLHNLVVGAIRDETGADLDALGSQAAWTSYEDVWGRLSERWHDGGQLATVPLRKEVEASASLAHLQGLVAQAAGMDVGSDPPQPLWLDGRLRVDDQGLRRVLGGPDLPGGQRVAAQRLLDLVSRPRR